MKKSFLLAMLAIGSLLFVAACKDSENALNDGVVNTSDPELEMDVGQTGNEIRVSVSAPGGAASAVNRLLTATTKFPQTRDYIAIDTAILTVFELRDDGQLTNIAAVVENAGNGEYQIELPDDGLVTNPSIIVAAEFGGALPLRGIVRDGMALISPETEIIVAALQDIAGGQLGNLANYELQRLISAMQAVELSALANTTTANDVVTLLGGLSKDYLSTQLTKILADSVDVATTTATDSLAGTFNRFDFIFTLSDSEAIGGSEAELGLADFFSINIDSEAGAQFVTDENGVAQLVEVNQLVTTPFSLYIEQNDERDFPFVNLDLEQVVEVLEPSAAGLAYTVLNDGSVEAPDEFSIVTLEDAFEAGGKPANVYIATARPSSRLIYNSSQTIGVVTGSEVEVAVLVDTDGEELLSIADVLAAAPITQTVSNAFTTLLRQPSEPVTPEMFDGNYAELSLSQVLPGGLFGSVVSALAHTEYSQSVAVAKDFRAFIAERSPIDGSITTRHQNGFLPDVITTLTINEITTQGELTASFSTEFQASGVVNTAHQELKGFVTKGAEFAVGLSYESDSEGMPITNEFNRYDTPIAGLTVLTKIDAAIQPEVGKRLQFSLQGIELDLHGNNARSMRSSLHGNTLTLENMPEGGRLIVDNLKHSEARQENSEVFPTLMDVNDTSAAVTRTYSNVTYDAFGEFSVESELDGVTDRWAGYVGAGGESVVLMRQRTPAPNSSTSDSASIGIYVGFSVSQK